ncbi:MAG TPA: right-handed parallel beta-helix repeat-containing protein [Acetobacteraceae bacterium]|nr:right-handed parallel beta-helix repeat-containing protein [Acetobacteraceae bacterium]
MSETFQPIPNFSGINAGQQFREAINDALGGTAPISPALSGASMTGGQATGTSISAAVAAALITDAADRTIEAWKTDAINFADYEGVDQSGMDDNSDMIAQALADAREQGKALYFPAGVWGYAATTTIQAGDRIFGDGYVTQFKYIGPRTSGAVETFVSTAALTVAIAAPATYGQPTILKDFRVTGAVDQVSTTYAAGLTGPAVQVQGLNTVVCKGLWIENFGDQGIFVTFNWNVLVEDCDLFQVCRDNIMASGSSFIRIVNNRIRHGDDNAISVHANLGEAWGRVQLLIITGNLIEDCPGISCQAAARTLISHNIVVRPRETGIGVFFVGSTGGGSATEGLAAAYSVEIADNQVYDVISRGNIDGLNSGADYIEIGSIAAQAGSAQGVPATNLTALGGSTVVSTRFPASQTWSADTAYQLGAVVVDSNGKVQVSISPANWAASTAVAVGQLITDSNGNLQECTTAGTTGSTHPSWATTQDATTTDNTATWTLAFVMPANQPSPSGIGQYTPYTPTSGASAPSWASTFNATTYDGTVRWQNKGSNTEASVVEPYPYTDNMLTNGSDTTTPLMPGMFLTVARNKCMRTISVTKGALYSRLGFGQMFTRYGYMNPVLGQAELQSNAIGLMIYSEANSTCLLRHVRAEGNTFAGQGSSVAIEPGVQILGGSIARNDMVDFLNYGVNFASASVKHRLTIDDNLVDGDPYMQNRGSGTGGAWQSGLTLVYAFRANSTTGIVARSNRIRNVNAVDDGDATAWQYFGNIVYCNPAATGFSTSNIGVGSVPAAGPGFMHVIEDGNPGDATFGTALNMPTLYAAAMPSSGAFVEGQFVWNSAPSIASGYVLLGWMRLTTGSSNTSGTDWAACYAADAS